MTAVPASAFVPEIEESCLSALLYGGDLRKVAGFLKEEHFVADCHQILFRTIGTAFEQFGTSNLPVVHRLLPADADTIFLARTGKSAAAYMAGLAGANIYGDAGLEKTGRAVVAQWARLKTAEAFAMFRDAAHDPATDAKKLIQSTGAQLDTIAAELRAGARQKSRVTIGEAASAALVEVEAAAQRGSGITGVPWGWVDVDRCTGGIQAGEMVVVAGRPGMCKTAVALCAARNTASRGAGTGFISLEMGAKPLAKRAITDMAYDWGVQIAYSDLITGRIQPADIDTLRSACRDIDDLPLWIEEQPGLTLNDIRVKTERMMEEAQARGAPLKVLFVDYLQLVRPTSRYQGNRNGEITEISNGLRELAREYDIAMVALSQLSRGIESRPLHDRRPILSDLRDSGAIEQDADTVIFLFREAYYLQRERGKDADAEADRICRLADVQNKLEFIIGKQRQGPTRTVDLFVDIACSAVRNAARAA